jgi:hypothetical protein
MKLRILAFIFAIAGLSLASCGTDDEVAPAPDPTPPTTGVILPKVIVKEVVDMYGINNYTREITNTYKFDNYNRLEFIYSNVYDSNNVDDNIIEYKNTFEFKYYPDGNLELFTRTDSDIDGSNERLIYRNTYEYNIANTIIATNIEGFPTTYYVSDDNYIRKVDWGSSYMLLDYKDGNLTETSFPNGIESDESSDIYGYDKKKNIFANMSTNNPAQTFLILENVYDAITASNANNPNKCTYVSKYYSYNIENNGYYNADGYPSLISYTIAHNDYHKSETTMTVTY